MTLTTSSDIDQEAEDSLREVVDDYNRGKPVQDQLTIEQYASEFMVKAGIKQLVDSRYDRSVARNATNLRKLPYDQRLQAIALLESMAQE